MAQTNEQLTRILEDTKQRFADAVTDVEYPYGDMVITIDRARMREVLAHLKEQGFNVLLDIAGVDGLKLGWNERFQLVYNLYALDTDLRLRVRVSVPESDLTVPSVSDLWQSANWAEREAYDMFGFLFDGHPNLERILNHREFEGHPLRKDYPILKGQWATTTSDLKPDLERE